MILTVGIITTEEGTDIGKGMFSSSKHMKVHMMKYSSITIHMYWSILHCIVELHLWGLHREKCIKKLLVVCCSFLLLLWTQADLQSNVS